MLLEYPREIVILHEDKRPRGFWWMGRIEETIPGGDGLVRSAIVRVSAGKGK
jgi:hypothetical protein